jgi:drug/metabolite transporter superfamily protein YnfA
MSADFVSGGTAVAAFVIALFFIRYWRQTRDPLFFMFAGGFLTLGISRLILAFLDEDDEGRVFVYGLRLVAFTLILVAIIHKNRTPPALPSAGRGAERDARKLVAVRGGEAPE